MTRKASRVSDKKSLLSFPFMILLGVNVDHVATLRQARYRDEANTHGGFVEPDPAAMAWLAEEGIR